MPLWAIVTGYRTGIEDMPPCEVLRIQKEGLLSRNCDSNRNEGSHTLSYGERFSLEKLKESKLID
jgi:hypothetical protein